jgi:hypothetical protein
MAFPTSRTRPCRWLDVYQGIWQIRDLAPSAQIRYGLLRAVLGKKWAGLHSSRKNRERVSDAMDTLRWRIDTPDPTEWFRKQEAKDLIRDCERFFFEFWRLVDLATDPDLKLAWELKEARRRIDALSAELTDAKELLESRVGELEQTRSELDQSRRDAQSWRDKFNSLEQEHDALISSDMKSALDHYSSGKGSGVLRTLRRKRK